MSAPPTRGPAMPPAWKTVMFSELAAGSWSTGTSLGRIALRVGWLTAKNACCTANRPSSSQTLPEVQRGLQPERRAGGDQARVVMSSSVRRSITSASAPPYRPNTTSGTRPNSAGQADVRRGAGDLVDLGRHGDDGQLGPDDRDDVGPPQAAEVRALERAGVGDQPPQLHRAACCQVAAGLRVAPCARSSNGCCEASVTVDGEVVGEIGEPGLLVYLGVTHDDGPAEIAWTARKIWDLRLLREEKSLSDLGAPVLVVSQFTLYGEARKGRRPTWQAAAPGPGERAGVRRGVRRARTPRRPRRAGRVRRRHAGRVGQRRPDHTDPGLAVTHLAG